MGLGFGIIFAPAVNMATAGVPRQDSGVASALVNTVQQVGGSIGISVLSAIAGNATTGYLIDHTGPQAPAIAATLGDTRAFTVSAALLGRGAILALLMLPSRKRLEELTSEASDPVIPMPESDVAAPALASPHQVASALHPVVKVMPVGLLCCSPVIDPGLPSGAPRPPL